MRALFTRGGLGYYHSSLHPLHDPMLHNPIRIVDLDGDKWWHQLGETLGNADLPENAQSCAGGMELQEDG